MEDAVRRKLLGLIGLGVRGRLAVVGVQQVRDAAMRHKLVYAIVAPNASKHSLDKVVPLLQAKRVRFVEGPSAEELGAAVGRETTAAVGIVDAKLARGIRAIVEGSGSVGARDSGPPRAQ
ncbi:MAG: L7Ae/L30e/S12e/Gadd45 family ribosomal protein [Gemmatimonadaceae bacterium]